LLDEDDGISLRCRSPPGRSGPARWKGRTISSSIVPSSSTGSTPDTSSSGPSLRPLLRHPQGAHPRRLKQGRDFLFDVDWQGTQQLYQKAETDVVRVFILPPSLAD
jgi:hypothetical protein